MRVDFDRHRAVHHIDQLDLLVPMVRCVERPLLQLDARRKVFVVPNQFKFTVHNESPFTNLQKVILSQSTLLYDTIISYHFFNCNIFLKVFNLDFRIKVNREVFIVLIQNNIEVLHLDYGRFGIIIAVK